MKRLLVILISLSRLAFAGGTNAGDQQAGMTFIQSIAPTTNGQIVNPANATSPAWSGQTGVPVTTPTGMGAFSGQPNTTIYGNAQGLGLSALGNNAQINCANYTPGQNPYQDQACAAVNFLNNQCIQPNNQDAKILQNTGTASQINPACNGTYGQGAAQFNYQNTLNSSDSMFATIAGLKQTANTAQGACGVQTTTTTPAQNQTVTCVTSTNTTDNTCSEYLNVSVLTSDTPASVQTSCTAGVLVGQYCQATTSSAANQSYVCPANYTLINNTCNETLTQGANSSYSCASGSTLEGSMCQAPATQGAGIAATNNGCATIPYSSLYNYDRMGTKSGSAVNYVSGTCSVITPTSTCASNGEGEITFELQRLTCRVDCAGYSTYYFQQTACVPVTSANFSCPSGYTLSGTTCNQLSVIPTPTPATVSYSCPSGYTLSGQNCIQNNSQPATPQVSCPNGGTLTGTQCVTTTTMPPNVTYSCSDGSAPQNGICITHTVQTSWTDTCSTYEQNAGITLNP